MFVHIQACIHETCSTSLSLCPCARETQEQRSATSSMFNLGAPPSGEPALLHPTDAANECYSGAAIKCCFKDVVVLQC